ncbi:actin cytoskeleton-regulatory complex protein pan1-like [Notolabrus celidotus]|uniref:actin cytoskeleton-regulatory complex protein pan1-like n=1 Tax=Notolabrus celidotus TaxID=1203425 RepID=UPI001490649B|nr:actin cytoskeleton-regulatory complex protein pan1-like [Notolabrus celidotus]
MWSGIPSCCACFGTQRLHNLFFIQARLTLRRKHLADIFSDFFPNVYSQYFTPITMNGVNNPLSWTESNTSAQVTPLKSCQVVLEKLSPECAAKATGHLESSGGHNELGDIPPIETDSDSGDSLFITQKPAPLPVRQRRGRNNHISDTTLPRDLEDHKDDSSSSSTASSAEIFRVYKKKCSKKYKLPEYSFPFLTRKHRGRGTRIQNKSLHNAGMVGFLTFVRELCQGCRTGEDVVSSLPTVDIDEDGISPLSENEEEGSENEDIKVVERKLFAVPLKTKRQQTWCNQLKQRNIRNDADAGQEPSQGEQCEGLDPTAAMATISRITEEENEQATSHGNSEALKTTRLDEGGQEEGGTPHSKQETTKSKSSTESTTQEEHGHLESDFRVEDPASSFAENGGKKKKKRRGSAEDEEQLQSSGVPEILNDEGKTQKKKRKKKKEKIITAEERGEEEGAAPQDTLESSFVKGKKKQLSFDDATRGEEECAVVSPLLALTESVERAPKKRKKRVKTNSEEVDQLPAPVEHANTEHLDNVQEKADEDQVGEKATKRKKKKKKKSENISGHGLAQGDDSVSVQETKRTSSFLSADAESSQSVEAPVAGAGKARVDAQDIETESAECNGNVDESNEGVMKKKKKKKKRKVLETHDGMEKDQDEPEVKRKKKRAGNETELVTPVESLEGSVDAEFISAEQTVVLKKKKKKRKDKTCDVIHQSPSAATEESGSERLKEPTPPPPEAPGNPAINDLGDKNERRSPKPTDNVSFNLTSLAKSAGSEPKDNKKKKKKQGSIQTAEENAMPSSSSDRNVKNMKAKKKLHYPSEDFLSDL